MKEKNLPAFLSENTMLQKVIDCIHDRIYIIDSGGTLLMINKAVEQDCDEKHSRDTLTGRKMQDLVDEGFAKDSLGLRVLESGKAQGHIYHEPEGYDLLAWGTPHEEDGKIKFVVCTEWDIANLMRMRDFILGAENQNTNIYLSDSYYNIRNKMAGDLVAKSSAMRQILKNAYIGARTDTTILIRGETGTGKEMIMRYIHYKSPRRNTPLIEVNCGAIPESLLESEFFGYVKGAFTGANNKGKAGIFELANHGTLFLDEIDALSLNAQSKLLRALQEKTVTRIGSHVNIPIDTKVIVATNADLNQLVKEKKFREDLFYRLNVLPLDIPPLRERPEDIPELVRYFTRMYNTKHRTEKTIASKDISLFLSYDWPGNIREMQNLIERTFLTTKDDRIPRRVWLQQLPVKTHSSLPTQIGDSNERINMKEMVDEYEKNLILSFLPKYENSRQFAELLGIDKSTINRKLAKHQIKV